MITPFQRFELLAEQSGTPTLRMSEFLEELTYQVNLASPIKGAGSPEGAIDADTTQLYMDTAGTAGNILYIKKSGSGNTGWILV